MSALIFTHPVQLDLALSPRQRSSTFFSTPCRGKDVYLRCSHLVSATRTSTIGAERIRLRKHQLDLGDEQTAGIVELVTELADRSIFVLDHASVAAADLVRLHRRCLVSKVLVWVGWLWSFRFKAVTGCGCSKDGGATL